MEQSFFFFIAKIKKLERKFNQISGMILPAVLDIYTVEYNFYTSILVSSYWHRALALYGLKVCWGPSISVRMYFGDLTRPMAYNQLARSIAEGFGC